MALLLRRLALALGVGASALLLGMAGWVYAKQDSLPYLPSDTVDRTPRDVGLEYEELEAITEDGETLRGWWVPVTAGRGTLVFFHGASGSRSRRVDAIKRFHSLGLSVLIVDYRGYGGSTGTPSEAGTYADARAAWDAAISRGATPESTVVFGRSLGGPIAAHLASQRPAAGLILESTFTSLRDLLRDLPLLAAVPGRVRAKYSTRTNLHAYTGPVLILHSHGDRLVPFRHAEQLRTAAGERGTLVEMVGSHGRAAQTTGRVYIEGLDRFLDSVLPD
jgi:alpha-beta hydrolase superfamily lysophospholipase